MEKEKRKEREFNLRRSAILEEAGKVFGAKGFHKTSVAEIASASGFAVGTLYRFFPGKEELYTAVLTEKLKTMYDGIRRAVDLETDLQRKIDTLVATQFRFVEENAEFCSIFVRGDHISFSEGGAELRKRMAADYAVYISFVEGVMRDGIRSGILKQMEPRLMAAALTGIMNSYASKWLSLSEGWALGENVRTVVDIFLQGVKKDAH
ncbi:MAG: TetR/AcrR family transcriptional regulator [Deltaproteobacteria bacterium]|nr:TetR/AcrR family transcriptional regulator [Deltaproteobacteria bacterium]